MIQYKSVVIDLKRIRNVPWFAVLAVVLSIGIAGNLFSIGFRANARAAASKPIKWVEFNVTASAMEKALKLDTESRDTETHLDWVELLSYLGTKYGGNFKKYKAKDMDAVAQKLREGSTMEQLTEKMEYYSYYHEAYEAVLGGMVGEYEIQTEDSLNAGSVEMQKKYGLKAYSPIAYGYSFSHYDDFGASRSYGFKRNHLGNDLLGNIGTPIVAVESGVVEMVGWNQYGGWRVGVRSFDGKRYYYYAHLRKDRPYHADLKEGGIVHAGDVIGYLGMTGYSSKENVNGMNVPHLHFGMQLVFDESQKESNNEIWINVYEIVKFLEHHKSPVVRNDETKEYFRKYQFTDPAVEALQGVIPQFPKHEPD